MIGPIMGKYFAHRCMNVGIRNEAVQLPFLEYINRILFVVRNNKGQGKKFIQFQNSLRYFFKWKFRTFILIDDNGAIMEANMSRSTYRYINCAGRYNRIIYVLGQ